MSEKASIAAKFVAEWMKDFVSSARFFGEAATIKQNDALEALSSGIG